MTNEELVDLIQAGDHVQDNMGLLYQQNRRFITGIALPFSSSVELDDLMQEAYFGLEKAVSKYDPTLGYAFLTYAENHIRLSIQRYCQNCGRLKRVPVHVLEQISKYQKFRSDFQAVVGDEPTDEEYCFYLGIENRRLKELRKYMTGSETASLDGIVPGTEDFTLADVIADDFNLEESVCDTLADEQAKTTIWGAVSDLGGNASEVVQGYYKNGETLQGISDRLEVSIERVRQIKNRAISNLRRNRKLKEAAEVYGYGCAQAYPEAPVSVERAIYQCGACGKLESRLAVTVKAPVPVPILQRCDCGATMHRIRSGKDMVCPACRKPLKKTDVVAVVRWD